MGLNDVGYLCRQVMLCFWQFSLTCAVYHLLEHETSSLSKRVMKEFLPLCLVLHSSLSVYISLFVCLVRITHVFTFPLLCRVMLSFLEIYNEKIKDLLYDHESETTSRCSGTRNPLTEAKDPIMPPKGSMKLQIRRNKANGIHVPGLTQVLVSSYEEVEVSACLQNLMR